MLQEDFQNYRIEVPERFSGVVTHFYVARNEGTHLISKTLVPTFQSIMVFNFGEPAKVVLDGYSTIYESKCLLFGPVKKQLTYELQPGTELLVVNFKDDAFYRFFGNVMFVNNAPKHPDVLLATNCFEQLGERLAVMNEAERIQTLLQFCEPYLKERSPIAAQLVEIDDETQNEVKAVAADMQVSERTIQKAYKRQFGFTSKEKQRYQRFLRVIRELHDAEETAPWQDIAYRYGYYDQSHLIHDFKHYLSVSPEQYLKFRQNLCLGNL